MATTLTGKGVLWGCNNISMTGVISTTLGQIQSNSFTRESDKAELRDGIGDVVGRAFYDHRRTIQITVIPSAASIATAKTNALAMLPAIGSVIAVVDTDDLTTDENYTVEECSISRTNTGMAEISMTVSNRDDNDAVTVVT